MTEDEYDMFMPVYESLFKSIEQQLKTEPLFAVSIENILKYAKRLDIEIKESETDSFLDGLSRYFSKLYVTAFVDRKEKVVLFKGGLIEKEKH